jgi:hypothetical protein
LALRLVIEFLVFETFGFLVAAREPFSPAADDDFPAEAVSKTGKFALGCGVLVMVRLLRWEEVSEVDGRALLSSLCEEGGGGGLGGGGGGGRGGGCESACESESMSLE